MEEQAIPDGHAEEIAPATRTERIASLDIIRGIAVLGILAANIVAFGQPWSAYSWPGGFLSGHDSTSDWLWVAQFVLVDGKMRGLFSLLFGAGMVLFMERARQRGASEMLLARRLAILLLFGLIHFYFIWRGDILVLYAISGLAGMMFLKFPAERALTLGLIGYVIGAIVYGVALGSAYLVSDTAFGAQPGMEASRGSVAEAKQATLEDDRIEIPIMTEGTYSDFVSHNLAEHLFDPFDNLVLLMLETVPLMIMGMGFYRFGWFNPGGDEGERRTWGWALVLLGGGASLTMGLWIKSGGLTYWGTMSAISAFSLLPRLPMIIGLALLLALYGNAASGWLAERLAAAGRAAFSNYIGTSLLMMLVFHSWAGGLWGELTRPELYLVVLLGWAMMLAWSGPWLSRYRYGPLEWLWRCLTYGRLFAFKR
ncbi:DUF418 domain-containing protein [Aurantiacibacter poecillastricola]|uniref:DUF418 domain-containing protein n=1 Tax=Aurantiacibacter poecillastricola TaxID=3064385 RepID=UPI00273E00F9|nr:DUF418 domain-containing protein [Aurantiacibacter sp. 219JJ12-13]MDP5262758.1 DUF418 domain-containing protein [Aurantiacibacter sp. 219JJ12-13]